jgi:hypothetical protein
MRRRWVKGSELSQRVPHGTIVTLELPYQKPVYEGAVYPRYFDAPADSSYHQVISTGVGTVVRKGRGDTGLIIPATRILL